MPLAQLGRHPEYHGAALHGQDLWLLIQRLDQGQGRVHFDIHTDDPAAEIARLEKLGAELVEQVHSWWVMRDPAGLLFCILPENPGRFTTATPRAGTDPRSCQPAPRPLCRIGARSGKAGVTADCVARLPYTEPGGVDSASGGPDVCHGVWVGEDLWDAYDTMGLSFEQHAADSAANAHYDRPAVLAALGPVTGRQVLDAACGPGLYVPELLERGAEVTAFDASPE